MSEPRSNSGAAFYFRDFHAAGHVAAREAGGEFEEGEPETISEPYVPLAPETVEALRAHGIELSPWRPTFDDGALYAGPPVAAEDVLSVYVVVNGSLGMSPGKVAAMAFHCGRRVAATSLTNWQPWLAQGKRVVVRVAETPHVFGRVTRECGGLTHSDEGLTEVERGAVCAYVTVPYRRAEVPKILRHKRCQLL